MSVALVTITHNGIGEAIVHAAESILGTPEMPMRHFSFANDDSADLLHDRLSDAISTLDSGHGVLVLTDLFGSTPSNVAQRLAPTHHVRVLSGISLPMVLRVFTYARLELGQLVQRASDGARVGVIESTPTDRTP